MRNCVLKYSGSKRKKIDRQKQSARLLMNMKVFLDLDGIIRDFVQGVIDKFRLNITHHDIDRWHYFEEELNIPDFWELLDDDFWANLPKTPFADRVLKIVYPYNTVILTSPTYNSAGGTQKWIRKNLPEYFDQKRYLIGPAKWACAERNSLLIDDYERNANDFLYAGGNSILFPAPWNSKREIAFDVGHFKTVFLYHVNTQDAYNYEIETGGYQTDGEKRGDPDFA